MVFVPTQNMVESVSETFAEYFPTIHFQSYHSRLDDEERRSAIEYWSSDLYNIHCIVGTSALTVGLDLLDVDTILLIGYSYGVLELCQQMGRESSRQFLSLQHSHLCRFGESKECCII
jgi:superfamily II DNA helicase RecQ